jgi:Uma2 family endonuclease
MYPSLPISVKNVCMEDCMALSNKAESIDKFTYTDYCTWDDTVRYELIHGEAYMMAAPNTWHQRILRGLYDQLGAFLRGKPCEPFFAPMDVRLFPREDRLDDTVVQPDLFVVCDQSKVVEEGIAGTPDFIIEILSPGTKLMDLNIKKKLYVEAGVREYWIVSKEALIKLVNTNGSWEESIVYLKNIELNEPVTVLDGCILTLTGV